MDVRSSGTDVFGREFRMVDTGGRKRVYGNRTSERTRFFFNVFRAFRLHTLRALDVEAYGILKYVTTVNVTGKQRRHEELFRAIERTVERVDNPGERRTVGKRPEKIQHRTNRRRPRQGHNRKLRARRCCTKPGIRLGESVEILLEATVVGWESNGRPMFWNVFLRSRLHGTERTSGDHPVNRPDLFDNNSSAVDEIRLRSCRLN